ncbi:hypothetical protein ACFX58_03525 [Sphingomonas sp. NCPPB 2930]
MSDRQDDRTQELLMLGKIHGMVEGLLEGQKQQDRRMDAVDSRLDGIDGRLRQVEQKAAVAGAVSGGAVAIGTALIVEGVKAYLSGGGLGR